MKKQSRNISFHFALLIVLLLTPCLGHAQPILCIWPLNWDYMGYITDNDAQFSGTVYNPTYVSGHSTNYATDFGSAGYAELEDAASLTGFGSVYTICCWFKRPNSDYGGIFKRAETIDSESCEIGIFTYQDDVYVVHKNGANTYTAAFEAGIGINTWYFISVVWDGSTLRLYVNAEEIEDPYTSGTPISPGTGGTCFIKYKDPYNNYYGALEDLQILEYALPQSTIEFAMGINW